jgi:23S rRNA G2445 N2-methylase RlmL
VDTENPDIQINVAIHNNRASVALDLAGEPLHRRRYRTDGLQVAAPMKETLAAAMLTWAGWPRIAQEGGPFIDFMCGSGTLPLEAAMIAGDIAPGLLRRKWGFSRWLGHDTEAWDTLADEASKRRVAGLDAIPPILASDIDARSIEIARRSLRRVELEKQVVLSVRDMDTVIPPAETSSGAEKGLIALNPPYGKRMLESGQLPTLYQHLRKTLETQWNGYRLAIITPDDSISEQLSLNPQHAYQVRNGPIDVSILTYQV